MNDVTGLASKPTEAKPAVEPEHSEADIEELSVTLLRTVNHVFSRDYMSHDPTFVAHLETRNNEYFAPLSLVAELPIVKALTSDTELLKVALASSDQVVFDEATQSARPTFKLVQRTTIILRDFPSSVTPEEVKALFKDQEQLVTSIVELKPEVGDNYFISFSDEEKTLSAWNFLRTQKRDGKPISARIKSESIIKNSYYVDPAVLQYQQQQQQKTEDVYSNSFWDQRQGYNANYRGGRGGASRYNNNGANNSRRRNNNASPNNNGGGKHDYPGRKQSGSRSNNSNNGGGANNNRRGNYTQTKEPYTNTNKTPLHASQWPTLAQAETQSGYKKQFRKYSKEQVVAIVSTSTPATPAWENADSLQNIINEAPTTQMEVLRPIQDGKVEFIEGKRGRRTSKSTGAKAPENKTTENTERKPAASAVEAKTPLEKTEKKEEKANEVVSTSTSTSTPYADAAKIAANGSN